jgi:hypothetical protein
MPTVPTHRSIGRAGALLPIFALLLGAAGCTTVDDDRPAPPFPPESGQAVMPQGVDYPAGPYGFAIGSVLANYEFVGYVDPVNQIAQAAPRQLIQLADFYNPHGDGVYGPGTPFTEGSPKPLALLIDMSARWCTVCRDEAKTVLPPKITKYRFNAVDNPNGRGEFMTDLAESITQGKPASYADADSWGKTYKMDVPLVVDPEYQFEPTMILGQAAWPANFIVDTRTMTIVEIWPGAPSFSFWTTFDSVLDGTWQQN